MKRYNPNFYIALLLIVTLFFSIMTIYAFGAQKESKPNVSAHSAALYIPETKEFLYLKNSDNIMPMASTTKIMTALVAIENSNISDTVEIDDSAIGVEGSSAYLRKGDVLTMEELLYALLLQSANDAAVAIAYHISGNVEDFAGLMNEKASSLGLSNTHFTNPHGLHDDDHYTTAEDLAIIAAAALDNDMLKKISSTYKKTFSTEDRTRTYVNHNKLLLSYDGCVGVKTGFTKKSGRCLVSAAEKNDLRCVGVTLNAPNDWNDHKTMLDYCYECVEKVHLADPFDHIYKLPVIGGSKDVISVLNPEGASLVLKKDNHNIDEQVKLVRYCIAPIKRGDLLGEIIYTVDGVKSARVSLVAAENVGVKQKDSILKKIISIFK